MLTPEVQQQLAELPPFKPVQYWTKDLPGLKDWISWMPTRISLNARTKNSIKKVLDRSSHSKPTHISAMDW